VSKIPEKTFRDASLLSTNSIVNRTIILVQKNYICCPHENKLRMEGLCIFVPFDICESSLYFQLIFAIGACR
jgi:hypothetical protein